MGVKLLWRVWSDSSKDNLYAIICVLKHTKRNRTFFREGFNPVKDSQKCTWSDRSLWGWASPPGQAWQRPRILSLSNKRNEVLASVLSLRRVLKGSCPVWQEEKPYLKCSLFGNQVLFSNMQKLQVDNVILMGTKYSGWSLPSVKTWCQQAIPTLRVKLRWFERGDF